MESVTGYKIAKPNGWDFYTGQTVNYRRNIGKRVSWDTKKVWSADVFIKKINIASANPNDCLFSDCFRYYLEPGVEYELYGKDFYPAGRFAIYKSRKSDVIIDKLNCSAYIVEGVPVYTEKRFGGFDELEVINEIKNLDELFGWKYSEAINPIEPLGQKHNVIQEDIDLLMSWVSLYKSYTVSIDISVAETIKKQIGSNVAHLIWDTLVASTADKTASRIWKELDGRTLYDVPMDSPVKRDFIFSFEALCYGYMGSLFPSIPKWKNIKHVKGEYPFQPAADLWRKGLIPSYYCKIWRLHSGKNAKVVYEERIP